MVDPLRTSQALGNLVDNALRHGRGRIRLVARRAPGGRAELHVRDQGPGAGLGLAIGTVIASAHGGSAHAANVDGGADVWVELPAATAR